MSARLTAFIILLASAATSWAHPHLQRRQAAGVTTRYWDCCKPSCSWPGKASLASSLKTCDANENVLTDPNTKSGCDGGTAWTCSNQQPWAVNDNLAYGFAAVALGGTTEAQTCCACYELAFQGGLAGKKMIVQATNTGNDVGSNQFDLAIPGGGQGQFSGCSQEYAAATTQSAWGAQYGGVSSQSACANLPERLQAGCNFRFGWMRGVDNPAVTFTSVTCPSDIVAKSGCQRA